MPSNRLDEVRDYDFADRVLALRQRAGLTQRELAALLGVRVRSIQAWEAGLSYPGAERLKQLIAFYLERGAFAAGREKEEASALWEAVRTHAARRIVPFDWSWFASLRRMATVAAAATPRRTPRVGARGDWGEVPDAAPSMVGPRSWRRSPAGCWTDRCRLVACWAMGGIGKTLLAARLAREVAPAVRRGVLAQPAQRPAGRGVAGRGHRRPLRTAGPSP